MANAKSVRVEVVYATRERQALYEINVPVNCTIAEAIHNCPVLHDFPEIDLSQNRVGLFGVLASLNDPINANDRIEIYRPLLVDPKEARRQRATQQARLKKQK